MKTRMETFHFKHNDLTSAATLETLLGKYKIINVYFDTMKKPEIEVRKLHETSARDWCTGKTQWDDFFFLNLLKWQFRMV